MHYKFPSLTYQLLLDFFKSLYQNTFRHIVNTSVNTLSLQEVQKRCLFLTCRWTWGGLIPWSQSGLCFCHTATMEEGNSLWFCLLFMFLQTVLGSRLLSYFALPVQLLIASTFIGALGNYTTLLGASFAYIVDQCKEKKQRTIRIAIIDFLFGVVSGLTGLSSGYFIRGLGFVWSFLIVTVALFCELALFYFSWGFDERVFISVNISVSWDRNL